MSKDDVMNFEIGKSEEFIVDEKLTGSAVVTEVNTENKTITLESLKPGDEGYVDPVELEKRMVEAELKRQENPDPVEVASMLLTLYTPRYCALVDKLSNRQLRRLAKMLAQHPTGKQYKASDEVEAEAMAIARNLLDSNFVLVMDTYREHSESIRNKANEEVAKAGPIEVHYGDLNENNEEGKVNG